MKYRKKPVVIDAMQVLFGKTEVNEIVDFVGVENLKGVHTEEPKIITLEGDMLISDGDYIIKGVQGEFYPCKPDIFEATYEKADKSNLTVMINVDEVIERFSEKLEERLEEMLNPSQITIDGSLSKDDVEELKSYRALEIKKPS